MMQTNRQEHGTTSNAASFAPMQQTHIPFSKLTFTMYGMHMKAYRSGDGKRLMAVVLDFVSIVNKKHDQNEYAKSKWPKLKQSCSFTTFDGYDVMDIAGLKALTKILPHIWMSHFHVSPELDKSFSSLSRLG
jgi:hypothetical protein